MEILLSRLLSVATGGLPHIYDGLCPDQMEGPLVRDIDCPACQVLIEVDNFLAENMKQPAPKIGFWGHKQPCFEFSNFYRAPVVINGKRWPTTEHYYQAQKFAEEAVQEHIRRQPTPRKAADEGRRLNLLRTDWEQVKEAVMATALTAKFAQHPDLHALLLGTGDAELVEASPYDFYWGAGKDGTGKNRLGILLMQLRLQLQGGDCDRK